MHKHFMLAALQQAWLGRGSCAPNPAVGAVLVHNNQIIASDFHKGPGLPHAEPLVLQHMPANITDLVLYVSLEPCNHWGRTPPCVSAIIQSGIKKVVYGFADPNPVVAGGQTTQLLAEQGIEAIHYPLPEIDRFYQSYQFWTQTQKPWVTAKMAQTLDGKIAASASKPVSLSNELCSDFTHEQRRHSDVILTTAETIHRDNPLLNARCSGEVFSKPVAILDRNLSLSGRERVFATASTVHLFYDAKLSMVRPIANCQYHAMPLAGEGLDLPTVVSQLGQTGYHDVWVEAGGRLFSALHEQGLVQRTWLYIVPKTLGPDAVDAWHGDSYFNRQHIISWHAKADNMVACVDWQEGICLPV